MTGATGAVSATGAIGAVSATGAANSPLEFCSAFLFSIVSVLFIFLAFPLTSNSLASCKLTSIITPDGNLTPLTTPESSISTLTQSSS